MSLEYRCPVFGINNLNKHQSYQLHAQVTNKCLGLKQIARDIKYKPKRHAHTRSTAHFYCQVKQLLRSNAKLTLKLITTE